MADLERENAALRDRIAARQIDDETFAALESLLVHAPVGFAFFDRELRFVRVNEVVARINGLPVEAHLGRSVREIAPSTRGSSSRSWSRSSAPGSRW